MFGFVTVDKGEMLVKDFETYKAIYCSLCKQLGKEYTFLSRFILSYDCTFYAVMALSLEKSCCAFSQGRCKFNPLKKCNYLKNHEDALSKAAALSIISMYYKLVDNIADGGCFEKLLCRFLMMFFSPCHKKAMKKYPDIEKAVSKMSKDQFKAERDLNCCIDKAADPTATMLSSVMSQLDDSDTNRRVLSAMGYFLGKWIYLIDAADDYDKDMKNGSFNPYVIAYGDSKAEYIDDINSSLNHCLSECLISYNLLKVNQLDRIIENLLFYGLPKKQKSILFKDKSK